MVGIGAAVALSSLSPIADAAPGNGKGKGKGGGPIIFQHVGTFDVTTNEGSTVAEIVAATRNGRKLVYTDSDSELVGFVNIANPYSPTADGVVPVDGEPTSVAIARQYALVGVNTSTETDVACLEDPTDPESEDSISYIDTWDGELWVINTRTRKVVAKIPLGGQPDSVAVSPNGRYAAIAIENERNEDVSGGLIPQGQDTKDETDFTPSPEQNLPGCDDVELTASGVPRPGKLIIVDLKGNPSKWTTRYVPLTGIADFAPEDPEPEFVDINKRNEAVVTLQENNHNVIVNLRSGKVIHDFSADAATIDFLDNTEEELGPQENGLIKFVEGPLERRREPDAVTWIGNNALGTANEGDYEDANGIEGGSRGFTIFSRKGRVRFDIGMDFEYDSARAGHYNEGRSENKGGEPEAIKYEKFGPRKVLLVGAERANVVGVYDVTHGLSSPEFVQLLPTGSGPEGFETIPQRKLFVVSAENSEDGFPSLITIYKGSRKNDIAYPQIESVLETDNASPNGTPLPWVAMSGLAGKPDDEDTIYGVSDSFLATGFIYAIDVSDKPALITHRIPLTDPNDLGGALGGEDFFPDLEGIAVAPEGGFWLASEGRKAKDGGVVRDNALIRTDENGVVLDYITLPDDLVVPNDADAGATNSGFEGIAVTDDGDGNTEYVYAVVQREWKEGTNGVLADPDNLVKIVRWDVKVGEWAFIHYEKAEPDSPWVGLSEITLLPDGTFAIIERDNKLGTDAVFKQVWQVDLANAPFTDDLTTALPVLTKAGDQTLLADVLDVLDENSLWVPDKLEGLAVSGPDGYVYIVTDNDGLDDAIGQTVFVGLGPVGYLEP
jgi:YVTN family beta-propeller protein